MWKLEFNRPQSSLSITWNMMASGIIQDLEFSNMRGDDIYYINQICINNHNDMLELHKQNARYNINAEIKIEDGEVRIYNQTKELDELYLIISKK
jgi:hypothetical protein